MIRILFVCLGNICRSPMAEFIMKDLARRKGTSAAFAIESAAISGEEEGNPVNPPALRCLSAHGIAAEASKRARKVRASDYDAFDYIFGMESRHVTRLVALFGGDPQGKVFRLRDSETTSGDIADPWYTGDFECAYRDIAKACEMWYANFAVNGIIR